MLMIGDAYTRKPSSPSTPAAEPPSSTDTSPTKAWADAQKQATQNAPQQTASAQPGDSLASIAERYHDTLPSVEEANSHIQPPSLLEIGETVDLPKKTPAQVVSGVDNSQIEPIIAAMAQANQADQSLTELEHGQVRDRGIIGDAQQASAQSWDAVEQKTYSMLLTNNSGAYPDQPAAKEVAQLNALEPGNTKFAAANNAALAQATQDWTQMGVTKPQLSPIINAYDAAKQTKASADVYLSNPAMPHNRAIADALNCSEQQANAKLQAAIEKSLTQAADQAGSNPQARSKAITERAANIQMAGPQDPAFQTAVDNANTDLQVTKPAEAVAEAYAEGGMQAGAQALKTATQNAGNPYYASQIIQASSGTIDSITRDLGSLAANSPRPGRGEQNGPLPSTTEFQQIYGELSASVAAADTITTSGKLSPDGKAAADLVAQSIVENTPKNMQTWQYLLYSGASSGATSNGDAALTMATAAAAKQHGDSDLAASLVQGAQVGIQSLQSKTNSDVDAFSTTTASLNKLRNTWGPFMTQTQLASATNGFLKDHPDVQQKANVELATIGQDGDAVVEAESAWSSYSGQLSGIDGTSDLASAATALTGQSSSTAFAVSQSNKENAAITNALSHPPSQHGGSVMRAILASPDWSIARAARSFINATLKTVKASKKATIGQGTFTTLSGLGLLLTAENAATKGLQLSSVQGAATSAYTALGFAKYTGELISGLAKNDIVNKFAQKAFGLSSNTLDDLKGLTDTPAFKKILGPAYYGAGALASFLEASDDFKNHDDFDGGADIVEGLGNIANAAKPLFAAVLPEEVAEGIAAGGSLLGLGAALATVIYGAIKSGEEQQQYQADSAKFLEVGLGLNSNTAEALSAPLDQSDGSSASAVLQAYARQYDMTPGQLLAKLNREPSDKMTQFINEAANMPMQSNGQYATSLSSDNPDQVGTHPVQEYAGKAPPITVQQAYQADSLRQLGYWADYLFGANQIG